MSYKIKTWLYIISGILLIGMVTVLTVNILLALLPFIVALYIFFKIKNYFARKKNNSENSYNREYKKTDNSISNNVDDTFGEVIDVDYEDINK